MSINTGAPQPHLLGTLLDGLSDMGPDPRAELARWREDPGYTLHCLELDRLARSRRHRPRLLLRWLQREQPPLASHARACCYCRLRILYVLGVTEALLCGDLLDRVRREEARRWTTPQHSDQLMDHLAEAAAAGQDDDAPPASRPPESHTEESLLRLFVAPQREALLQEIVAGVQDNAPAAEAMLRDYLDAWFGPYARRVQTFLGSSTPEPIREPHGALVALIRNHPGPHLTADDLDRRFLHLLTRHLGDPSLLSGPRRREEQILAARTASRDRPPRQEQSPAPRAARRVAAPPPAPQPEGGAPPPSRRVVLLWVGALLQVARLATNERMRLRMVRQKPSRDPATTTPAGEAFEFDHELEPYIKEMLLLCHDRQRQLCRVQITPGPRTSTPPLQAILRGPDGRMIASAWLLERKITLGPVHRGLYQLQLQKNDELIWSTEVLLDEREEQ